MSKINVKYNGNKLEWKDRFYGSGGTWTPGAVLAIDEPAARKLLKHPEFEEVDQFDALDVQEPEADKKDEEEQVEEPPLVDIDSMTKTKLVEFAHRNFGLKLPDTLKIGEMRDQVRMQMGKKPA